MVDEDVTIFVVKCVCALGSFVFRDNEWLSSLE